MSRAFLKLPPPSSKKEKLNPREIEDKEPLSSSQIAYILELHEGVPACDEFGNPKVGLNRILRNFPHKFPGKEVSEARVLYLLRTGR